MPHLMQPKKEEEDDDEMKFPCKKTKIKTEENGAVKHTKTKSVCHKKVKTSVKNEVV